MYVSLLAGTKGCFDDVPVDKIKLAENALHREVKAKHVKLTQALSTGDKPSDEQNETVIKLAKEIAETYKPA
jgi:F0F1-type ATP synthase alpha subunit